MHFKASFFPAERALFAYLALTGSIILLFYGQVQHALTAIGFRVAAFLFVWLLAAIQRKHASGSAFQVARLLSPVAMLAYLYSETDRMNNLLFGEDLDPVFSGLEYSLFGSQPALEFALRIPANPFAEAMYFGYFSYYLMLAVVPVAIFLKKGPGEANRAVFILLFSFFVYYLVFILLPVAGPQFYFTDWPPLPAGYAFGDIMRFIQEWGEAPTAAFPSSHVSICLMLVALAARHTRELLWVILPVTVLLVLSTVYIRAHYVIDVLAAFAVTMPLYLLSTRVYNKISQEN